VTPAEIQEQVAASYWDWKNLLANPRYCRQGNRISWNRFSGGIIREPITYEKVRSLVETRQFSFQSAYDGSVFQLLYEFEDSGELRLARLAFYNVNLPLTEEELEVGGPVPDFSDVFIPWLRFDYSREHAAGVLHRESHMHLSGFPNARLAVAGVPSPRQFVEFVLATCFPEYYADHRLDQSGSYRDRNTLQEVNVACIPGTSVAAVDHIIHVRVP
jgi:hypothetical protein